MRKKGVLQLISTAFVLFSSTSYAQHVNSDKPLNCDSTCIIPDSRTTPLPKAQIAGSPTIISQGPSRAQCGSAHQSVLPEPPSSFLCAPGMASNVATINDDGDITYTWTCGTALGTQTCQAKQRVTGACGLDHGRTLSSNPSNLCATGQSYGFNFNGNQYTWGCAGNYGAPAQCSASYTPSIPPIAAYVGKTTCLNPATGVQQCAVTKWTLISPTQLEYRLFNGMHTAIFSIDENGNGIINYGGNNNCNNGSIKIQAGGILFGGGCPGFGAWLN